MKTITVTISDCQELCPLHASFPVLTRTLQVDSIFHSLDKAKEA